MTVKNAKKVTWKVTKKAAQIVKLTKKSKKGATIKGLKKGTAKISVQMKNGKKKVKKTITVKVSSAKKVVVTAEPAKTTNKPTNGPTNGPTKEPVKDPKYGVTSEGYFEVNLSKVKQGEGTEPFVVINAGKAGYTGSVTITKITFVK